MGEDDGRSLVKQALADPLTLPQIRQALAKLLVADETGNGATNEH